MIPNIERNAWRALWAAQLGWMLDAMDFLLFTFALLPIQRELDLTKKEMAVPLAAGLIASAIGGVVFGRVADRFGRVQAMSISIFLYSAATAGMATSATLTQLIAWRVLVGLGMGGEWTCGSVLVAETWPPQHRAKAMGIMQSGWAIGALIAAGLSALVLERAGWRVLFFIGAAPALIVYFIRRHVQEPEVWRRQVAAPSKWTELFTAAHRRNVVLAATLASSVLVAFWGVTSWLPAFLASPVSEGGAGLTITKSSAWLILLQAGAFFGYITFGWIADRLGRRPAFTAFMIAAAVVVPLFAFRAHEPWALLVVGPLVGYFAHGYFSVFGAMLAELFPTHIRATAQGFCYNAGRLVSALAPYAIGAAATRYGLGVSISADAMFFLAGAILIWLLPETKGTAL
jgi:MFS family permease